jgi:integrase
MKAPVVISPGDFHRLIERMSLPMRIACYLMYHGGLRISEVTKLRWSDVDLRSARGDEGSTLLVRQSKNLVTRTVVMHRELREMLEYYHRLLGRPADGQVVPVRDTGRVYTIVKRNAARIGMRHLRPHDLRHSYATRLVEDGLPLTDVQALLGHKNLATTQRYVHPSVTGIRRRYKERGWL